MELLFICLLLAIVVAMIASSKGRSPGAWFLYGALLWPIALVHILLIPRPTAVDDERLLAGGEHRKCPFCAELVRREAIVCKHCGRDIAPETTARAATSEVRAPARAYPEPAAASVPAAAGRRSTDPLAFGSRVNSPQYGHGTVTEIGPERATVAFDHYGSQIVPRSSLRLIVEG